MKIDLIIISGPSGVGKKTVIESILQKSDDYMLSVSATTRKPRMNETDGVDYFFLTKKEFQKRIRSHSFVEWAIVHGQFYGTPLENLQKAISLKKHLLLEIDVQGGMNLKKQYHEKALLIFIQPPCFEDLIIRLRSRATESKEEIKKRMKTAKLEMLCANEYDYRVTNDEVERTAYEIMHIVDSFEEKGCYEEKH